MVAHIGIRVYATRGYGIRGFERFRREQDRRKGEHLASVSITHPSLPVPTREHRAGWGPRFAQDGAPTLVALHADCGSFAFHPNLRKPRRLGTPDALRMTNKDEGERFAWVHARGNFAEAVCFQCGYGARW